MTDPGRVLTHLVYTYAALWALGLAAGFWVLAVLVLAPVLLRSRLTPSSVAVLVVVCSLILSSMIGVAAGYASFDRAVGFVANLCVWLALAGMIAVVESTSTNELRRLVRAAIALGSLHSAVAVASVLVHPGLLPFPLLGPFADALPPGVAAFTTNELVVESWLDGSVLRTVGMMGNTTWSGAVSALTVLLLWSRSGWSRSTVVIRSLALGVCLTGVYLSYSRATELALVAAMVVLVLRHVARTYRLGRATVVSTVGLLIAAAIAYAGQILDAVRALNAAREGSAVSRGEIYEATLTRIGDLGIPILGYGLKPRGDGLVASVATHSTYLGLTFRAGLLGLLALLLFGVMLWRRCTAGTALPQAIILFVALWAVFEDLDPGHLVPVFLAVAVALTRLDPPEPSRGAPSNVSTTEEDLDVRVDRGHASTPG